MQQQLQSEDYELGLHEMISVLIAIKKSRAVGVNRVSGRVGY